MQPSRPSLSPESPVSIDADRDASGSGHLQPFDASLRSAAERLEASSAPERDPAQGRGEASGARASSGGRDSGSRDAPQAGPSGRGEGAARSGREAGSKQSAGAPAPSGGEAGAARAGAGKAAGNKAAGPRAQGKQTTATNENREAPTKSAPTKSKTTGGAEASKKGAKTPSKDGHTGHLQAAQAEGTGGADGGAKASVGKKNGKGKPAAKAFRPLGKLQGLGKETSGTGWTAVGRPAGGGTQDPGVYRVARRRAASGAQQGPAGADAPQGKGDQTPGTQSQAKSRKASSSGTAATAASKDQPSGTARQPAGESGRQAASSKGKMGDRRVQKGSAPSQAKGESQARSKAKPGQAGGRSSGGSGQQAGGQSKHDRGGRQGGGRKTGTKGLDKLETPKASSHKGQDTPLGRSASPSDLFSGRGAERGGQGWAASLADAGRGASTGKGTRVGTSAGPPRTLPTAWLKTAASGPMTTKQTANGWKAVEVALGEENGKVTVQARSESGMMNVSVRFSEGHLRAQMAANARQLQDTMQAQYGSDVDLSFAGGNPDGSEGQASDGSLSERRSAPSSLTESSDEAAENDIMHRRRPNGENEWIG